MGYLEIESLTPYFVGQVDEGDVGYSLKFKGDHGQVHEKRYPRLDLSFRTRPMQSGSSKNKTM